MSLTFNLISAAVVYSIIALILFLNRDKLEVENKILFLFKSKSGLNIIRKIGSKIKWFWKTFGTIAVFTSFYFMALIVNVLVKGVFDIMEKQEVAPKIVPVIPGVPVPGAPFFLPFWYGIISLGICVVIHEFAHGIMMKAEGLELESSGFGFLLALPVAFVEPIKDQMENAEPIKRMRIASAGPFANIVFAFVLSLLLSTTFYPFLSNQIEYIGTKITKVGKGLPAAEVGLKKGDVVVEVDDKEVKTNKDLLKILEGKTPNSTLKVKTAAGEEFNVGLVKEKNRTKMGVWIKNEYKYEEEAVKKFSKPFLSAMFWLKGLFSWIQRLNFLIGVVNFLPIWAIDGGKILGGLLDYLIPKKKFENIILSSILYFVLALFIINFLVPYIK